MNKATTFTNLVKHVQRNEDVLLTLIFSLLSKGFKLNLGSTFTTHIVNTQADKLKLIEM
jgi:hypothetical protein